MTNSPRPSSAPPLRSSAEQRRGGPETSATKNDASTGEVVHEDLVTVTIDDVELQVTKGTLVIRAAELIGTAIPRFCDHPLLDPVAACRQCLVEITDAGNGRGMPKPQPSCAIEVADHMVVKTQLTSPVADKAQHGQMEFLLVNHPLDCPICDKGGECPLQNQAMSNGRGDSRYEGVKRTFPKPINISAQVLLDRDRCILCARCTRFSEQIAGDPFIDMVERGALQQVGYYAKEPFESYFSGNTIQICPVGALTSSAYRFRSRPFDLVSTPSIAEHDAAGAAIRVDHRRGEVMRRMAGDDPEVNEEWISDKDRFAFRSGRLDDRVRTPLVRDDDGSFRAASWPEALNVAATGLRAAHGQTGVLTGGRVTLENAYAYSKFARAVLSTNDIDFRSRPHSAEEAEFLAHVVAGRGVSAGRGLDDAAPVTFSALEGASTVLLVALEAEEECPTLFLRLRKAYRKSKLPVWTVAGLLSNGARKMGAGLVPCLPGAEAATVASLPHEVQLDERSIILVGERAAQSAGTLTATLALARSSGARLAWVPRRAGDRGAVEAGCLPNLLPGARPVTDAVARVDAQAAWGVDSLPDRPGRDADALLRAAAEGTVGGIVVGGVEPGDFDDPRVVLAGLENAGFVVSLEQRFTAVTERADVVFPICLNEERSGTFWNWEGRDRPFPTVIRRDNAMDDVRVLAALADAMGTPLGFRTARAARAELADFGVWDGDRAAAPAAVPGQPARPAGAAEVALASWRLLLDDSRSADNEPALLATARRPIARINPRTAAAAGIHGRSHTIEPTTWMSVTTASGQTTLWPVEMVEDMVLGAVWVPGRPRATTAVATQPGDLVTIAAAEAPGNTERPSHGREVHGGSSPLRTTGGEAQ